MQFGGLSKFVLLLKFIGKLVKIFVLFFHKISKISWLSQVWRYMEYFFPVLLLLVLTKPKKYRGTHSRDKYNVSAIGPSYLGRC